MTIEALPDTARIWIFGATRPLDASQREALDADLRGFVRGWAAHGSQLLAAHAIVENTFVVVAVDENLRGASGCSIDAMVRHLAGCEDTIGATLLDGARIWYRAEGGEIASCARSEFRERAERGDVDETTRVFDPTIESLGELRSSGFERSAGDSWHARLLPSRRTADSA